MASRCLARQPKTTFSHYDRRYLINRVVVNREIVAATAAVAAGLYGAWPGTVQARV